MSEKETVKNVYISADSVKLDKKDSYSLDIGQRHTYRRTKLFNGVIGNNCRAVGDVMVAD